MKVLEDLLDDLILALPDRGSTLTVYGPQDQCRALYVKGLGWFKCSAANGKFMASSQNIVSKVLKQSIRDQVLHIALRDIVATNAFKERSVLSDVSNALEDLIIHLNLKYAPVDGRPSRYVTSDAIHPLMITVQVYFDHTSEEGAFMESFSLDMESS